MLKILPLFKLGLQSSSSSMVFCPSPGLRSKAFTVARRRHYHDISPQNCTRLREVKSCYYILLCPAIKPQQHVDSFELKPRVKMTMYEGDLWIRRLKSEKK